MDILAVVRMTMFSKSAGAMEQPLEELTYLVPPGAEVEGSAMNAYWTNYIRLADAYVNGYDFFQWVSFEKQQERNEIDIQYECNILGPNTEAILNVHRQFYNQAVTELRKDDDEYSRKFAMELLNNYNDELKNQQSAAKKIQDWFRKQIHCTDCGLECRMARFTPLCAACYWEEDAHMKRQRRS
jgi:hypothetical protein